MVRTVVGSVGCLHKKGASALSNGGSLWIGSGGGRLTGDYPVRLRDRGRVVTVKTDASRVPPSDRSVNVSPGSAPKGTPRRSLSNMPKELMGGL